MFSPKYHLSDQLAVQLSHIEQLTSKLKQTHIPPPVLNHIRKQCLLSLTHYSTQIEGNQLSLEQVSQVIDQGKKYGLLRDEKEVKNYFSLLEQIPSVLEKFHPSIDSKLILECHSKILDGIVEKEFRGTFRNIQNAVYESSTHRLIYLPPTSNDVTGLISDLCLWLQSTHIHPLVMAAIFHNQFVTIHPFVDGNGRSARFLSLCLLEAKGYDWKQIVPIDQYYATDRALYYATLQQNYSHNYYDGRFDTDFTKWIVYYMDGIQAVLEGTLNQVELYKTENILMNNRQSKILKVLEKTKYITATQYGKRFLISTRMAARDLSQLVQWGKLSIIGKARSTKYFLN